jgi:hypothetical protein
MQFYHHRSIVFNACYIFEICIYFSLHSVNIIWHLQIYLRVLYITPNRSYVLLCGNMLYLYLV